MSKQELPTIKANGASASEEASPRQLLPGVKQVIAVSSGKGGVGKSTVAVHLALTLPRKGYRVGLMDADVYGPSVPTMLASFSPPEQRGGMLVPIEHQGIAFMSLALMTDDSSPVIWRGPMASKLIQTFLTQVDWGPLDFLLIDLPPGTGDVQLTLTQTAPLTGAVIVTTPQDVAVNVTLRGIKMFDQVKVPILGVVENMSGFTCSHCGQETAIFRQGGGENTAKSLGLPFLGRIPLDPQLTESCDGGVELPQDPRPYVQAFDKIATILIAQLAKLGSAPSASEPLPVDLVTEGGQLQITWSDDQLTTISFVDLRFHCPCAECVDENSGQRKLKRESIADDVHLIGWRTVGRYGVQITWSDGHGTGIFTHSYLRELSSLS